MKIDVEYIQSEHIGIFKRYGNKVILRAWLNRYLVEDFRLWLKKLSRR